MSRPDIAKLLQEQVTFTDEIWQWIDLYCDAIGTITAEGLRHESDLAETPYQQLMVSLVHRDLSSMSSIYLLLRSESLHQAAAQVRLLCEGVITWRYIAIDCEVRAQQFSDFLPIEACRFAEALLEWTEDGTNPVHVAKLKQGIEELRAERHEVFEQFTFTDRKGKERHFQNWANKNIRDQAADCGDDTERLYGVVYRQMSAYVHGSAWSLRRQRAYSRKYHDAGVVHTDIATIVRTTIAIWEQWCRTCESELGWNVTGAIPAIAERMQTLDANHFPATT